MKTKTGGRNTRIAYIDTARAASIFMIVMGHLLRKGHAADFLTSTGVATFFLLSGLVYHWKNNRRAYWLGRFRRLYLPYLGVAVFSIVVYRLLGSFAAGKIGIGIKDTSIPRNLLAMLYANSKDHSMKWNETLWFIPCFLVVLLMVNGVERLLRRGSGGKQRKDHGGREGIHSVGGENWAAAKDELKNDEKDATQNDGKDDAQNDGKDATQNDGKDDAQEIRGILIRVLLCALSLALHSVITRQLHWHLPWQAETALGMFPVYEAGIVVRLLLERNQEFCGKTTSDTSRAYVPKDAARGISSSACEKATSGNSSAGGAKGTVRGKSYEILEKANSEISHEGGAKDAAHGMRLISAADGWSMERKAAGWKWLCGGIALIVLDLLLTAVNGQISIRTDKYPHDLVSFLVLGIGAAGVVVLAAAGSTPELIRSRGSISRSGKKRENPILYVGQQSLDIMLWNKFPVLVVQTVLPLFLPGFAGLFLEQDNLRGVLVALPLTVACIFLCLVWVRVLREMAAVLKRLGRR